MPQYDGSIRINTKIDSKNASAQLMALENRIVKTADKIASLRSKMDSLKDAEIPTAEYENLDTYISKLESHLENLSASMKDMESKGMQGTDVWKNTADTIENVTAELQKAKAEMQQLVDTGRAFTLGQDTEEYAKLGQQLRYAESDMKVLNRRHDELIAKLNKASDGYKKLSNTAKKSFDKINKSAGTVLKNMLKYSLGIQGIYALFSKLRSAIKEGFGNLYNESERLKNAVDGLKTSSLTLKNSFAAAFRPLVEMAIPYIQKTAEALTDLMNIVGQFTAAIAGQRNYTKAIKQTTAALKEENKASNKQLSGLDKLNNLTSGAGDDDGAGQMFEEVPVDSGVIDFLQKIEDFLKPIIDYAQNLKDVFTQGFWDGLGDWQYKWGSIKDSIASIKESLKDIFTDPAVLSSVDGFLQSAVYLLGTIAGSVSSIGLTIGTNLVGGIEKYLSQNSGRIKKYIISMFDIRKDVNNLFSSLFQSIAYVFEAFASGDGQQLTANFIGIFTDSFMGITELASKSFRDIANIAIHPFVDNKEAFRTALEGFLGVLAEVTGTIKQGIDDTFDKLNEVYDAHFKPFFDSVAQGLSDLTGQFLEFWNGSVQPIIGQWAADFDELWKSHIQPLLDNSKEFLGKIADLLKVVWENYLQPMIAWIIANVLPIILPVIQAIWNILKDFVGFILDARNAIITVLGGLIDFITGVLSGNWDKAFQGLQDAVKGFADYISAIIGGALHLILDVVMIYVELIKAKIDLFLQKIKSIVEFAFNFIKTNIFNKFNKIKSGFANFGTNVSNIWTNFWDGIGNKVKSILDGVKEIIKDAFDWIMDKISAITSALSGISGSATSALGGGFGSSFGGFSFSNYSPAMAALSNVEFPGYATGQVIPTSTKKHLAWLGDNPRETEVVSPLSTMKQANKEAFLEVLSELGLSGVRNRNSGGETFVFQVDGETFFEITRKYAKEYFECTGRPAFPI